MSEIFKKIYSDGLEPGTKIFSTWGVQEVINVVDTGTGNLVTYKQGSTGDQQFEKFFEYSDLVTIFNK